MPHRPTIWKRCALLLVLTMLLGLGSRSDAAVREYAVISIKIGAGESTSINTGTLVFELWPDLAPKTVQNFKHLANTRFYDGTASHRLIPTFMIQAGDPNTRSNANVKFFGQGGPGHTIPDELAKESDASWEKRKHVRGILSMAHSNNSERSDTGGSQFFVMLENASHLDGVHASFGTLTYGSEFLEKIKQAPTFKSDTTAFDFNNNGIFDDNEKQIIIKAFNGDEPTLKALVSKNQDQELTDEERAFVTNATAGFSDLNNDRELTEGELSDPINNTPHKTDQPTDRIAIQSVRVLGLDDASTGLHFSFKPTTYSGLLRTSNRSSIVGQYQVSVQSTGAVSGTVEYLWLKRSFSGAFTRKEEQVRGLGSTTMNRFFAEANLQMIKFSPSGETLDCQIQLDSSLNHGGTENSISLNLSSSISGLLPYSGFSESLAQSSKLALSRQYGSIAYRSQAWMRDGSNWIDGSSLMRGTSHFSIRTNPFLGLCLMSGRLANGTPYAAGRTISSEHGANLLPLYSSTLDPKEPLELSELYMQVKTKGLVLGGIELPDKNSAIAAKCYLRWLHPETAEPKAPLKNRFIVDNETYTTPWTPPVRNTMMKPFSSPSPRGQLMLNETPFNFSLVRNTTAVFDQPTSAAKPVLSFAPATGAFSGVFNDTSTQPARRRTFSGVLLNSTNATGGFGYYLDSTSSKSVRILPIVP
jgi:peptidyl-prolyl cis-trans isomerase B (cyclophilin B)